MGHREITKWILSTLLLTGPMVGFALILFLPAALLAEFINKRFAVDDDWSMLALPTGAILGLILGVRYRCQKWFRYFAGVMLVLVVGSIFALLIPLQPPDSTPEGMNRLPYAIGNAIRAALLLTVFFTGGISFVLAAITKFVVDFIHKHRGTTS